MPDEDSLARQLHTLAHYQHAIEELGYCTRLLEKSASQPSLPGPLLLVGLAQDARGRERTLNMMFMPFDEQADFDYLSLIQCYTPLPFTLTAAYQPAVEQLLPAVNTRVPLGHFGLTAEAHLYHRYMIASEKWALPEYQTVQQLLAVLEHVQNIFAPVIEAVATGEQSVEQTLLTLTNPV